MFFKKSLSEHSLPVGVMFYAVFFLNAKCVVVSGLKPQRLVVFHMLESRNAFRMKFWPYGNFNGKYRGDFSKTRLWPYRGCLVMCGHIKALADSGREREFSSGFLVCALFLSHDEICFFFFLSLST